MKIYLIAGRARSGKTLVSKILKELLEDQNEKTIITEYSKYIKIFAKEILNWDGITEPKPRTFLQEMGDFVRKRNKDTFFTERMKEDLEIYAHFVRNVIISDVRMPKEIEELKDYNIIKIKVINEKNSNDLTLEQQNHITEHALDDYKAFDYIIKTKEKEELKEELKKIIEGVKK